MRKLSSELLLALIKTFISERFAALNAIVTGQVKTCSCFIGGAMDNIKLYEIDPAYVKYLSGYALIFSITGSLVSPMKGNISASF